MENAWTWIVAVVVALSGVVFWWQTMQNPQIRVDLRPEFIVAQPTDPTPIDTSSTTTEVSTAENSAP